MKTFTGIAILFILVLSFVFTGCRGIETQQDPIDKALPAIDFDIDTLPTPGAGKATVVGQVFDETSQEPMVNVTIRLAEVYREGGEGAYVLDTAFSPGTYSGDNGVYILQDVPAGEYVLIIGDVMDIYKIIPDEENHPKTWDVPEGQIVNFGQIFVDLIP